MFGSVDGHALQINELRGTKPTEKIDLSSKRLGVASAIIIASCIKENGVLMELKYAAAPRVFAFVSAPIDIVPPSLGSLANNELCGVTSLGTGIYTTEGITKLREALKGSAVTSLECAAAPKCSL